MRCDACGRPAEYGDDPLEAVRRAREFGFVKEGDRWLCEGCASDVRNATREVMRDPAMEDTNVMREAMRERGIVGVANGVTVQEAQAFLDWDRVHTRRALDSLFMLGEAKRTRPRQSRDRRRHYWLLKSGA